MTVNRVTREKYYNNFQISDNKLKLLCKNIINFAENLGYKMDKLSSKSKSVKLNMKKLNKLVKKKMKNENDQSTASVK